MMNLNHYEYALLRREASDEPLVPTETLARLDTWRDGFVDLNEGDKRSLHEMLKDLLGSSDFDSLDDMEQNAVFSMMARFLQ